MEQTELTADTAYEDGICSTCGRPRDGDVCTDRYGLEL